MSKMCFVVCAGDEPGGINKRIGLKLQTQLLLADPILSTGESQDILYLYDENYYQAYDMTTVYVWEVHLCERRKTI